MQKIEEIIAAVFDQTVNVLLSPLDPNNRLYFLYIISSVVFAWFIYKGIQKLGSEATKQDSEAASGSFLRFLFPKRVWSHPSAWLDLRYFLFHRVLVYFLLFGLGTWSSVVGFRAASGGITFTEALLLAEESPGFGLMVSIVYMIITIMVVDFIGFVTHYLQHKIPILWQFHKVHHSAEVMHPISNFREHPIDNFAYILFVGVGYGIVNGLAARIFGHVPSMPMLIGVPLVMFFFNFTAYNLRHSHVWLRWPGVWSKVFPSPAHHHVHHSCHPDHLDKNFAFILPFWDVLFGTYHMPEDNRDVKFGIVEDASELNSCLRLYWIPFRDAYRVLRYGTKGEGEVAAPNPPPKAQVPAE